MRRLILMATLVGTPALADWSLTHKSDPITDAASASLTLAQDPIFMQLGCEKGDSQIFSVLVGTTAYVGNRPTSRPAVVRFDQAAPLTAQWGHSNNYALLLEGQMQFINLLRRSQKVAVRLTSSDGAPVDLVFRATGAAAQVDKFMATCKALGIVGTAR